MREGGRDPASDLVAARAGRDRLPARRRRAGRASSSRTSTASSAEAALALARVRPRASSRSAPATSVRAVGRRPAAPDLHVRHDREAEGRAAHARELLLDEPLVRPRDRRSGRDDVVLQVLPQFHCGGWNVQSLLALVEGRDASCSSAASTPARALELIEREARHDDDGRARELPLHGAGAALRATPTSRRCGSPSSAARRCRCRCSTTWRRARRRDRAGLRPDRGGAERALPAARGRAPQGRLGRQAVPVRRRATSADDGELLVRGPNVFPGYWRNPEATAAAFRDGWLHTGDVAERDDEGNYRIRGRLKDMVVSGGENVYPAEIEAVLHEHPAVADAAVVGVPDERWGEVVRRVRRARRAGRRGRAARSTAATRLARFKVPKSFHVVDELPRNSMGKVQKSELEQVTRMTDVVTNVDGRPLSQRGLDTRRRLLDAAEHVFGDARLPRRVDRQGRRGRRRRGGHVLPLLRLEEVDLRRARARPEPPRAPCDEGGLVDRARRGSSRSCSASRRTSASRPSTRRSTGSSARPSSSRPEMLRYHYDRLSARLRRGAARRRRTPARSASSIPRSRRAR